MPIDTVMALAHGISAERAQSFEFRVMNEEALLAHGAARPLFGWGGYGRNLLHDPVTGRALSVSDGMWIIRLGMNGWMGYIAEFGLLAMPLMLLARVSLRQVPAPAVAAMALIYAANLVDLLPNATLVPLTWLIGGALLGQAEALRRSGQAAQTAAAMPRARCCRRHPHARVDGSALPAAFGCIRLSRPASHGRTHVETQSCCSPRLAMVVDLP
ncbi:MAG: hypothetical protein HZT43_20105 [Exiguobacterium profundum]|nr:MAG: hypothetical protein HZT43_20105 [Exiguobacterium profundum]